MRRTRALLRQRGEATIIGHMKRLPMMLSVVLMLFASVAGACLQAYGTDLDAHRVSFYSLRGPALIRHVLHPEPRASWIAEATRLCADRRNVRLPEPE
jgi:hypothetical protein